MKSVRSTLLCSLAMAMSSGTVFAQTAATLPDAKDVIARYVKASGGAEALKKITSRVVKGKMMIKEAGIGGSILTMSLKNGKAYTEVEIQGIGTEKQGSDGTTFWSQSQFTGTRILEGVEREQYVKENDFESDLHPEKYYTSMKVTGIEKVGEEDCHRVEKTKKDGDKQIDFYSVKTGLAMKSVNPVTTPLGKMEIVTLVTDYRKVGDLLVSFKSEQALPNNMTQVITIESVEVNVDVDEGKFELPEEIKKLKAKAAGR